MSAHKHLIGTLKEVEMEDGLLREYMMAVARLCNLTVVNEGFHKFEPHGETGFLVLSESHFSCHTWPERGEVFLDLYCCSETFDPYECKKVIECIFDASFSNFLVLLRN